jgi:D-alanyl-D-alanine carboxypeptidase (penicillin-binding protein 5/6)
MGEQMKKVIKVGAVLGLVAVAGICGGSRLVYQGITKAKADAGYMTEVSAKENKSKELNITAKAAFLMEANSGKVLFSKDADKQLPIASMVKVMTLAVIYDALESGQIKMDDDVMVSRNASGMGGSQAFLDFDNKYKVEELVKSIILASANDSCVAMAEHLFGSEDEFVAKMNEKARQLGMKNTNYANCTGLPAVGGVSTAEDCAKVYAHIMKSKYYNLFNNVWMYDLKHPSGRVTGLTNTNRHARFYQGCEGGKTGFTSESGHCITVTAARRNLKPVAVIIGASDSTTRFDESRALMDYVFDNYDSKLVVSSGTAVGEVKLKKSVEEKVSVFPRDNFYDLVKKGDKNQPTINVELAGSVNAPVGKSDAIGKIIVTEDGKVIAEIDIVTNEDIKSMNYFDAVKKIVDKFKI